MHIESLTDREIYSQFKEFQEEWNTRKARMINTFTPSDGFKIIESKKAVWSFEEEELKKKLAETYMSKELYSKTTILTPKKVFENIGIAKASALKGLFKEKIELRVLVLKT